MNALDPADLLIEVINLRTRCGDLSDDIKKLNAHIVGLETQIRWMGGSPCLRVGNHDTTTGNAELPRTKTTNGSGDGTGNGISRNVLTNNAIGARMNGLNVNCGNLVID